MRELKLTPLEMKRLIQNTRMIGQGNFGVTFEHNGRLIKLDKYLYSLLRVNDDADFTFDQVYHKYKPDFADPLQIARLVEKQKNITLTSLPEGIVTINGRTTGIIIPYHRNHLALEKLSPKDYKRLLIILRKLLQEVRELADNEISQEDLAHFPDKWSRKKEYNVLYQGDTPQIIDLAGDFVRVGQDFTDPSLMYRSLADVILDFFVLNQLETDVKEEDITDPKKAEALIDELERRLKGK